MPGVKGAKLGCVSGDEFESIQTDRDPIRQARRATELLAIYQERSAELAQLRREAIERAAVEQGLSYAAVAGKIGLSKGRITQIRQSG